MAKTIKIEIDADGEFTVDLSGFKGQGCGKVMEDFGGSERPTLERLKPEFRQQERAQEVNRG